MPPLPIPPKRGHGSAALSARTLLARGGAAALFVLACLAPGCGARPRGLRSNLQTIGAADLGRLLAEARGQPVLVHVWATWCGPCREEFPVLLQAREGFIARGGGVMLVSADPPSQMDGVTRYLVEQGAAFPSYVIDNPNAAFINTLCPEWSGALPASFLFDAGGTLAQWWEGSATAERYRKAAEAVLATTE